MRTRSERAASVGTTVRRMLEKMTLRELAERSGIAHSTLYGIAKGGAPQGKTLDRLEAWIEEEGLVPDDPSDTGDHPDGGREDPLDSVWDQLPDVSFLKPEAREEYDRLVGSYVTRGWQPEVVARAARNLTNVLSGANSMRMGGFKAPDLPASEQLLAIREMAKIVERIYGEIGRTGRT